MTKWWEENRNSNIVKERNKKIAISKLGIPLTKKTKDKISINLNNFYKDNPNSTRGFQKGDKNYSKINKVWNKGLTKKQIRE